MFDKLEFFGYFSIGFGKFSFKVSVRTKDFIGDLGIFSNFCSSISNFLFEVKLKLLLFSFLFYFKLFSLK